MPVAITELSPSIRDQLEMIQTDKLYYEGLISRKSTVTAQLGDILKAHPENKFEIATGAITVPKENIYASSVLDDVLSVANILDSFSIRDSLKEDINIADVLDEKDISVDIGTNVIKDVESNTNIRDSVKTVNKSIK
ncbi:MAG: hypothetical protein R2741_14395 [Methanolobus sp.]